MRISYIYIIFWLKDVKKHRRTTSLCEKYKKTQESYEENKIPLKILETPVKSKVLAETDKENMINSDIKSFDNCNSEEKTKGNFMVFIKNLCEILNLDNHPYDEFEQILEKSFLIKYLYL